VLQGGLFYANCKRRVRRSGSRTEEGCLWKEAALSDAIPGLSRIPLKYYKKADVVCYAIMNLTAII
jgi:hypothetical protein